MKKIYSWYLDQRRYKLLIPFLFLVLFSEEKLNAQNCSVNSGVDFTSCPNVTINLVGNKSGLFQGAGVTTWSQVDGPSVTINSSNGLTSSISGITPSTVYKFAIQATCLDGSLVTDIVTITTNPLTNPNAGSDAMYCPGTYALAANSPGTGETGQWTVVGTNNGITISTPTSPTSDIILDGNKAGATTLRWTISNATTGCSAYDDVVISNKGGITIVTAGPDQSLNGCYSSTTSATLGSSFAGNGTGGQGGLWSCVSGPSTPTFGNATVYNTSMSNLKEGVYTIRWTVSGACASGVDDMVITVATPKGNVTNAIITSADQVFCDGRTSAVLVGSTPIYANETVLWEKTSGVGTITSPNTTTSTVTGLTGNSTSLYKYTITNSLTGCTSASTVRGIYYNVAPAINVNSGNDMILAPNATSASVPFTISGGNTTQYTIISYPAGYTAPSWTAASSPQTILGLDKIGTYVARFKRYSNIGVGGCSEAYDDVTIYVSQTPTGANAGTDQLLACTVDNTALAGNNPIVGSGNWSQVSGLNTATIETPILNNSNITGLISGKYVFRWTISAGNNATPTQDEVNVVVASSTPTTANAGSDLSICHSTPLILSGNIAALNETGTWNVNPNSGVTFSDTHNSKATVTGLSASTAYTFTWTITNACGASSDDAIITTSTTQGPIQSIAGTDQCLASGATSATLAANNPVSGTGLWTKINGPACTFTNATLYNTTVTGMTDGTYKLEWAITYNSCSVSRDTVIITISAPATTANAGVDQNICGVSATLAGNTPAIGTGHWIQTVGNAGVTITDSTAPSSTITGLNDGFYTFRWTISNNACSSNYDDVIIKVSTPPTTTDAGIDQTVCGTNSTILAANTITNGNGYWNVVSAPTAPTFSSNTSPTATISNLVMGTYTLQWVSQNGSSCPISTDNVVITVTPNANAGADVNLCNQSELQLSGNAASTGTWTTFSGPNSPTITTTGGNTATVSVMIAGTYTFRYSISVPGCNTFDDMVVVNSGLATAADAGINLEQCGGTTISLNGNAPAGGETAAWSKISGPGGTTFSPNGQNATFTGASSGQYWFKYTITNGNCSSSSQVKSEVYATPTTANAGSDQNVCGYTTNFAGNTPTVGIGNWSQISGPGTSTIGSIISPASSVTCSASGTYVFRWTISNGTCAPSTDDVTLNINVPPTIPNAGLDQNLCNLTSATLAGNTIVTGTGSWSQISGPNTSTITDSSDPLSTVTNLIAGTYVFRWTSTYLTCSAIDDVTINIYATPSTATSGGDLSICNYTTAALNGNTPAVGVGTWSQLTGPNTVTINNVNLPTSTLSGTMVGVYSFRWTIANGTCPSSSTDISLTVNALPSIAQAGIDQSLCNVASTTMAATTPTSGTGTWSKVSGPNIPTITNPNLPNTTITVMIPGVYVFDWTVANGSCTSSDQVQVSIADIPTIANAGSDQIICGTNVAKMGGNIPTVGVGTWTRISGPNTPTITSPNSGTSTITGLINGTYVFRWTITNSPCSSSSDDVQLQVSTSNATTSDAGLDQTGLSMCGLTSTTLAANNPTVGTGVWSIVSGIGGSFGNTTSRTSSFTGNAGDTYVLRWTITSVACVSTDDVTITFPKIPTVSNAGLDQTGLSMCGLTSTVLEGNTPTVGSGLWTIVSGTGGSFLDAANPTTTFSGTASTTYSLKWTISNSPCSSSESLVTVIFKEIPTAPTIGTIVQPTCSVATGQVDLNGLSAVGTWTITPSLGTAATGSGAAYTFSGLTAATTYSFTTTNADGCTSIASANVVINSQPPTPIAPTASATLQPTCLVPLGTIAVNSSIVGLNFSIDGTDYTNSTGVFTGVSAGGYAVTSKNSFGCISPATTNVTLNAPICSDLSINKTVDNSSPDVGYNIVFTISVTNNGPANATGVKVTDVIPSGYSYVSDDASGNYNSTTGLWTVGNLANSSSTTLRITVTVNATGSYANTASVLGDQGDPVPSNNTSTNTPIPVTVSNLSIVKSVDNTNPNVGDNVVFTLTATNIGPSDATGVKVADVLASGYTYISDNGSGSYNSLTGLWDIGDLANSATSTLKVTVLVKASGGYTNTATITGDQNDPILTDNSSTVTPVPIPQANLAIDKTVDNSTPVVGGNVIFTLTVTNNGPSDATGVKATDILPSGYTYVSDNGSGAYVQPSGLWSIGNLSNGSSESLRITATVNVTGSYANTASVVGDQNDPILGNNTSTNTPVPVSQCDLEIVKTVSSGTFNFGDNVIFTLTVINHGPSSATGVLVTDVLPSGYTYHSDNGNSAYSHSNGRWTIGNLGNGSSVSLNITVKVNDLGERTNTAIVTGEQTDPSTVNNTSAATPTIIDHLPIAIDDNAKTKIDEEVIISILTNDSGLEDIPLTITITSQPTHGTVVINNDNTVTYKPALGYKGEDVFTYQVCDVDGDCTNANVYITIESELIIPDGFSPNGDGINDNFVIPDIAKYNKVSLEIFNRWGNIVYKSNDYKNDWDGRSNMGVSIGNQLPVGTYFYIAKIIDNGKKFTGYVYLNK